MLIQNKKTLSFPNQTHSNSSIQFLQVFEECSKFPPDEHFQFQVNISTKEERIEGRGNDDHLLEDHLRQRKRLLA